MDKILVLVRHGKAQTRNRDIPDEQRELTEAGRRALRAHMPLVARRLDFEGVVLEPAQIWTSPAERAVGTAEELLASLQNEGLPIEPEMRPCTSLLGQNEDMFLEELRNTSSRVVYAVGHNPMIEDIAERLTGVHLPFATGGMAAIRISWSAHAAVEQEPDTRLLWFVQGPEAKRWKTLIEMEHKLKSANETVHKRLISFLADPSDVETMHKFRVSIRTFRSLLAFVRPFQKKGQNAAMQDDLREVVWLTSRLRELDVLYAELAEQEGIDQGLLSAVNIQRNDERGRVYRQLHGKKVRKRLSRVSAEVNRIEWKRQYSWGGLPAGIVQKRFNGMVSDIYARLGALHIEDAEETHTVRKRAKRVRYAATQFADMLTADAADVSVAMEEVQDSLGALCDARVNVEIVDDFPVVGLSESALRDLMEFYEKNRRFVLASTGGIEDASRG